MERSALITREDFVDLVKFAMMTRLPYLNTIKAAAALSGLQMLDPTCFDRRRDVAVQQAADLAAYLTNSKSVACPGWFRTREL